MHSTKSLIGNMVLMGVAGVVIGFYAGFGVGQNGKSYNDGYNDGNVDGIEEGCTYTVKLYEEAHKKAKAIQEVKEAGSKVTTDDIIHRKMTLEEKQSIKCFNSHFSAEDQIIINNAAKRNNLREDLYSILYAIRKAENGPKNLEFGIIHPACAREMQKRPNETLDIQAGWCAATIQKNFDRWLQDSSPKDFIIYLGGVYCPTIGATNDPNGLNKNWIKNVKHWRTKIYEVKE